MRTRSRRSRSRLLAAGLATSLLLAGCSEPDATAKDLVDVLASPGEPGAETLSEAEALCIAELISAQYDQEAINEIARASTAADLPPGSRRALADAAEECVETPAG